MDCSHIQFCTDKSKVDIQQVRELFVISAFWAKDRKLEDIRIAIANSNPVVTVWDKNKIIGFARATSDGIYRACIWDVIIHPDFRGLGLGRKLVETVLAHPLLNRVERVYLTTTNHKSFYQRIGFQCNSTTTMVLYNDRKLDSVSLLEQNSKEIL